MNKTQQVQKIIDEGLLPNNSLTENEKVLIWEINKYKLALDAEKQSYNDLMSGKNIPRGSRP